MARKPHALAIPLPGQGHINPLMRFCKKLASQEGFTITFVNIEPYHYRIAELNTKEDDPSQKLDIRRACIPFDEVPDPQRPPFSVQRQFRALQTLAPHIEQLLLKLLQDDPPVTCLISDMYLTGPTQAVADRLNIPRIAFYPASQSVLLFSNYILEGVVSLEEVLETVMKRERLKEDIFVEGLPGLPTLSSADIMNYPDDNSFLYEFNSKILHESKERAHAIVVNSFHEIEGPALAVDFGVPLYAVGPLVEPLENDTRTSLWKEDEECMMWLNQQPHQSVLYVSFGSFISLSKSQFEEIAAGLLSSGRCFLWVFRPDLVKDASYESFAVEFLSQSNGKGYVADWVAQSSVLSHPAVAGFLTHCGWNSTIEAVSHGVPMLCFPFFSDQFMDAKFVIEEWKVGLGFKVCKESGMVERDEVQRVIQMLMEGETGQLLHKNANHFKTVSNQALLPGGASSHNIQALIQSLR